MTATRSPFSAGLSSLLALLASLCCASAAGALWAVVELSIRHRLDLLAWLLGRLNRRMLLAAPRAMAAGVAALGLGLAALYRQCLLTGAMIANGLGITLGTALHEAGLDSLLYIARLSTYPASWLCYLVGALLAAWATRPRAAAACA